MDLSTMAMTALLVFVIVDFLKRVLPKMDPKIVQIVVFIVGVLAVFLIAETQWADTEVFHKVALGDMDFWTKFATGLMVGVGATGIDRLENGILNVGENQPPNPNP